MDGQQQYRNISFFPGANPVAIMSQGRQSVSPNGR